MIQHLAYAEQPLNYQEEYQLLHCDHRVQEEEVKASSLQGGHFQDSRNLAKRNKMKITIREIKKNSSLQKSSLQSQHIRQTQSPQQCT